MISPIESVYNVINYWITNQMTPDGLLHDVEMYIPSSGMYDHLDAPFIWIEKTEITTTTAISHSNAMALQVPVSIVCCAEIIDTLQEAEQYSQNIASRVISSLIFHTTRIRPCGNNLKIRSFKVNRIYPNSNPTNTFEIRNQTMMVCACRIDVLFVFEVDWMVYEDEKGIPQNILPDNTLLHDVITNGE